MTMVTNSPTPLRERKKLETRARIIEHAVRIFGERGMTAPTVEEIAAAADVGKGTIYNYFSTKEEIVVAFMVEVEKLVQAKVADFAARRGPLASILADFIRYQLELKEPYRDFVRVFMAQVYTRGSELMPHFEEMQNAIDPPLIELFRSLMRRGLMRNDVHLASLIEIFKLLHMGIVTVWINDSPPYRETMYLLEEEMRLLSQGLAGSETRRSRGKGNQSGPERQGKSVEN
ncbi:MAG: TetR/AcrR family transcriptional regulator [Terriglobia bacterium]|jgi:TetR/AcrR family fatty acid metabolism transcriptional regulator